jgi:hypothetical protein
MKKQYTEQELSTLIGLVEKEFAGIVSDSVAAPLAKSEESKEDKSSEKDKKPSDSKEEKSASPSEEKDKSQANDSKAPESKEKHDDAAELKSQSPAEDAGKSQEHREPTADANDHCDYDDEDHEHMHKMYRSMSRGELKAHHDSVRQALDGHGMEKCGDMSMGKSEDTAKAVEVKAETIVVPNQEVEMLKSELSAEKAKAADLKKNFDAVQEFLTKLVKKTGAPQGKAITELSIIAKSEDVQETKQLSKSEVNEILMKKASDANLPANDRQAINAYYLNGSNLNTISHLLKN